MSDDLLDRDAVGQARAVHTGTVTPVELVRAAIARVEAVDPGVNAVVLRRFDQALDEAASVDRTAPFAGVPILVKDAGEELQGFSHHLGTAVLRRIGHRSPVTTPLTATLQHLGFVVLGKTNVPELSAGVTTEPTVYGPTRNPWAPERTAGGSSGGSASAVAAGMVAVAHGSDGTGSLRIPASACGVVTLKPSAGRVATVPPAGQPDDGGVWASFFLTRSVRDLQALLRAVGSPVPRLRRRDDPLRVGILADDPIIGIPVHAECAAAVQRTGQLLGGLGHVVEPAHPPALEQLFAPIAAPIATLVAVARAAQTRWLEQIVGRSLQPGDIDPAAIEEADRGAAVPALTVTRAQAAVNGAMARLHPWWRDYDVLVTPTMRRPPWHLGQEAGPLQAGLFNAPFSFTGHPAVSLPLHRTADGLPVGVQLVAAVGSDERLLDLASALEDAAPWPLLAPSTA